MQPRTAPLHTRVWVSGSSRALPLPEACASCWCEPYAGEGCPADRLLVGPDADLASPRVKICSRHAVGYPRLASPSLTGTPSMLASYTP